MPGAQGPTLEAGGIFDTIGSFFRANGGPVQAGRAYTVGEMGRELFVPNADGRVMPVIAGAGSGPASYDNRRSYSIDARGAQIGVADQITSAIARYDAETQRTQFERAEMARRAFG